ncbi:hypothetical protein GFH30_04905 [Acinetobacter wanghuae]|uniref:Uncharacterized protein n=1 Tax=Acinetobacter wanghuae TaxID=2662362 RepID=A0ABX6D2K1_9GAMM|nr:hypothetical protein GFH30_04905 [Acinetobacter wanghuae]
MVTQLMALVLLFFKLISYPRFGLTIKFNSPIFHWSYWHNFAIFYFHIIFNTMINSDCSTNIFTR